MEKYSFLISVYAKDDPEYFRLAMESMIGQSVPADEIVLVIDGPIGEQLSDMINKYCLAYPNLIIPCRLEQNVGLGMALNEGIKSAKNELIARMDSDDISLPSRCEKQLECFAENENLGIVGSYVGEFIKDPNKVISIRRVPTLEKQIYDYNKRRSAFNHPSVMFKKSVVINIGMYSNLRRNQDIELFGRMMYNHISCSNISEVLLYYRVAGDSYKRRKNWANTSSYIAVIYSFYKKGYSTLVDLLLVLISQLLLFILPNFAIRVLYRHFLRR